MSVVFTTIIKSIADMFSILILMLIVGLVISVAGVIMLSENIKSRSQFASLDLALFAYFTCVTQDGWAQVKEEQFIDPDDPDAPSNAALIYAEYYVFIALSFAIGAYVLANLLVAVMMIYLDESMGEMANEESKERDFEGSEADEEMEEEDLAKLLDPVAILDESVESVPLEALTDALEDYPEGERPMRCMMPYCLSKVSQPVLERYLFLQVALSQNLNEYKQFRDDLDSIINELLSRNPEWADMEEEAKLTNRIEGRKHIYRSELTRKVSKPAVAKQVDNLHVAQGDILSELMRMNVDTQNTATMDLIVGKAGRKIANNMTKK